MYNAQIYKYLINKKLPCFWLYNLYLTFVWAYICTVRLGLRIYDKALGSNRILIIFWQLGICEYIGHIMHILGISNIVYTYILAYISIMHLSISRKTGKTLQKIFSNKNVYVLCLKSFFIAARNITQINFYYCKEIFLPFQYLINHTWINFWQ